VARLGKASRLPAALEELDSPFMPLGGGLVVHTINDANHEPRCRPRRRGTRLRSRNSIVSSYSCFEDFGEDTQAYGYTATVGLSPSCEHDVVAQLVELRQRLAQYVTRDGRFPVDEHFFAEQNARLVRNGEAYYRWNLRDRHMMETLEAILTHVGQQGRARGIIWAHNSHLGDASATSMSRRGELNLGQLVRERFDDRAVLVGFTTHDGTVTAASDWDGPAERSVSGRPSPRATSIYCTPRASSDSCSG
jgi:erythromycin esterase-like protein